MTEYDLMIRDNIRETLIKCRTEKGISQAELSKVIGVPTPTIASWEQGVSLPNLQTLYKLAKFYLKSMDYMYGEEKTDDEPIQEKIEKRASVESYQNADIHQ